MRRTQVTRTDVQAALTRAAHRSAMQHPLATWAPERDREAVRILARLDLAAAAGTMMAAARNVLSQSAKRWGHAFATRG